MRNMNSHVSTTATSAMTKPTFSRVRSSSTGSQVLASNVFVCGKLKPCGSFHGPKTSQLTNCCAT